MRSWSELEIRGMNMQGVNFLEPIYYTMVYGPVKSGKSSELVSAIRNLRLAGVDNDKIMVFKHELEDNANKGRIVSSSGLYEDVIEVRSADEIYYSLLRNPKSKYVFIAGANFFDKLEGQVGEFGSDKPDICNLTKAIVDSKKFVVLSGIPLDGEGNYFNNMPELMALSQNYVGKTGICFNDGNLATKSKKINGEYMPVCNSCFYNLSQNLGDFSSQKILSVVGPMFSSKTETLCNLLGELKIISEKTDKLERTIVFKPSIDTRYSEDSEIVSHNKRAVASYSVGDCRDIEEIISLEENSGKNQIVIDEVQFIKGVSELIRDYSRFGYSFILTGLNRDFRGEAFGDNDIGRILCLSDKIDCRSTICSYPGCENVATETQRIIEKDGISMPASYNDPIVVVGGNDSYRAYCKHHHRTLRKNDPNPFGELRYALK